MWCIIIFCIIIGIPSEAHSLETTTYSYGTMQSNVPANYTSGTSVVNEGTVRDNLPVGKERAPSVYNYGKMVYSDGIDLGEDEEVSECLKLFGYKI